MGEVQQRVLGVAATSVLFLLAPALADAKKFYADDPLWEVPQPMNVREAAQRKLDDFHEFFYMTFAKPGEKAKEGAPIRALSANTLGEVPDSEWYVNRHWKKRMTREELQRGPGNSRPPSMEKAWTVTSVKSEGITPGMTIKDARGRTYQIKFDSPKNAELATGADVVGSKFFYALGYYTPENYIVYFDRKQLVLGENTRLVDYRGVERRMMDRDIDVILQSVPRDARGRYRAVASLFLSGKPLGPFRYHGMRTDDPNDVIPHEHRRELRGLRVFAAWLNHTDTKSLNSLDMLVEENGRQFIRHHLIDFSAAFGTDAFTPKSPRNGYVHLLDWPDATKNFLSLGLWPHDYMLEDFPYSKGAGNIASEHFDPERWRGHWYNPSFVNCLPDDAFWAARQVMSFTEAEIRALVETAQYSDAEAVNYLVKTLVERRDKIGRLYFSRVLPLDEFHVTGGRLEWEDLGARHALLSPAECKVEWFRFDNNSETRTPVAGNSNAIPPTTAGPYLMARITAMDQRKAISVYLRNRGPAYEVVGVEREW